MLIDVYQEPRGNHFPVKRRLVKRRPKRGDRKEETGFTQAFENVRAKGGWYALPHLPIRHHRDAFSCRANMAHVRESRPDSGLGFQKNFKPFKLFPPRSEAVGYRIDLERPDSLAQGDAVFNAASARKYGTYKTVKASVWPWLPGTSL